MESKSGKQGLATRIGAILIFGPALFLLVILFLLKTGSTDLDLGWIFLLSGVAFLAFTTIRNFISTIGTSTKRAISTEAEMGLIGIGLGLVSPLAMLSYYFYGVAVLSVMIYFAKIFIFKERA